MRRSPGFTLIELMTTVGIVAILSAVALPSYSDYVSRSRITDAVSGLASLQVKMEQFFQDQRTYVGACDAAALALLSAPPGNFTFACPQLDTSAYTVTATGRQPMVGFGYALVQSSVGGLVHTTTQLPAGWVIPTNANCWVLKKDGSC